MGQKVFGLIEQIDPQFVIFDADMDVHAADDEAATDAGQIRRQRRIALVLRGLLAAVAADRMARGGNRGQAMLCGQLRRGPAQIGEVGPGLGERGRRARADLDLGAHELDADLIRKRRLQRLEQRWRRRDQLARCRVDQEVFLFDAKGKRWFA